MRLSFVILFLISLGTHAQDYYAGPLIQLLKSSKVNQDFELKSSVELRQRSFQVLENKEESWRNSQQRISFQSIMETKRLSNLNFGLGGMYRLNLNGNNQYRSIQQISHKYNLNGIKAGSRFRLDQTWRKSDEFVFRIRYRYSVQIPLNGFVLNDKEWYLKSGFELLGLFDDNQSVESRYLVSLGSLRQKIAKAEFGVDYRILHLNTAIHTLWLNLNLYIN